MRKDVVEVGLQVSQEAGIEVTLQSSYYRMMMLLRFLRGDGADGSYCPSDD